MAPLSLRCRCGQVNLSLTRATPADTNRATCYCDDCQAFLHAIDRADLLNEQWGSDIVQVAPSALTVTSGAEQIVGLRLKPKGLFRFYSRCCQTPLGNSMKAIPFIGLLPGGLGLSANALDEHFGPPAGAIFGQFAKDTPPPGSTKFDFRLMAKAIKHLLGWKLKGQGSPHPYFDPKTKEPRFPVTVLAGEAREELRSKCGPARPQN